MDYDITIIGAGCVGLACGMILSQEGYSVLVIERWPYFGEEVSSRNSEVIHAGIYYKPNSLKAKLCVAGNASIYKHCEKYDIPYRKCGKLIVATKDDQFERLESIFENAKEIGARNLSIISGKEARKLEPNIKCKLAIKSPSSGILNTFRLMQSFEAIAIEHNADIIYNHKIIGLEYKGNYWESSVKDQSGEFFKIKSKFVINSAGLDSDKIAELAGIDIEKKNYELNYAHGRYFRFKPALGKIANRLVYPIPEQNTPGLGIHVTVDLAGGVRLGPDVHFSENKIKDYSISENLRPKFFNAASKYLKNFKEDDIFADYSSIRPKLQKKGKPQRDFVIKEESELGLPGLINLIGIESPGITASIEIGKMVKEIISKD